MLSSCRTISPSMCRCRSRTNHRFDLLFSWPLQKADMFRVQESRLWLLATSGYYGPSAGLHVRKLLVSLCLPCEDSFNICDMESTPLANMRSIECVRSPLVLPRNHVHQGKIESEDILDPHVCWQAIY